MLRDVEQLPVLKPTASDLIAIRYGESQGRAHLTGVQALVRLVLDARRADIQRGRPTAAFVSGYEGSPLGGFDLELGRIGSLLAEVGVGFQPAVNEELAATAIMGTQLAPTRPDALVSGVTGFWYGKSPGVDRATDALRHANMAGTHPDGGALALCGDDPAAKSSTVPGASEALLADIGMPVLFPSDSQDVLDLGLHAVAMSRASGLWVAVKIVTAVADGASAVEFSPDRVTPAAPEGPPWRHTPDARLLQPTSGELEQSLTGIRLDRARAYAAANHLDKIMTPPGPARVGIVAAGSTYRAVAHALQRLGLDEAEAARRGLRVLKLAAIHPLVPSVIIDFAAGLDEIIVIEDKRALIEAGVTAILYPRPDRPRLSGKRDPQGRELFRSHGELDADTIAAVLARRLDAIGSFPSISAHLDGNGHPVSARPTPARWPAGDSSRPGRELPITVTSRTPYFCSGCPHNTSTRVPDGAIVGAGIGCHTLALAIPSERSGDIIGLGQMGGEGATWIGMSRYVAAGHFFQNLGDGTFFHSGSLAVRAAIAANVNITYKLLYNSAVAMTGGQQAQGGVPVPDLCRLLLAEGVARIVITTPQPRRVPYRRQLPSQVTIANRDQIVSVQEHLARVPGVTVLIHDQECATELRRKRKRGLAAAPATRAMINERVCEGCGDCGARSNCLSLQPVSTAFGRKTRIDQSSCNLDFSCIDGDCPSFLSVRPGSGQRSPKAAPQPPELPDRPIDLTSEYHVRMTGIGGSGIVTLSQVLARAAALAGYHVRSLDQTGLAQKGGPVVSDVRFGPDPVMAGRGAAGECDLYLACDALVATEPGNLVVTDADRTVAIVSVSEIVTGPMVLDPAKRMPGQAEIVAAITGRTRSDAARFLDARRAANALLGHDQYANLLLAGVAFEAGALPIPAAAIEAAIRDNGAAADRNVAAFRFGRLAVADPEKFAAAERGGAAGSGSADSGLAESVRQELGAAAPADLVELVAHRASELTAYQNREYARRYVTAVAGILRRDPGRESGPEITAAAARNLFALMAYKDEYEVARLSLDPALAEAVEREFGPGAKVSYRLHPPILRTLGLRRKITLGPWIRVAFRLLAGMRRLRGTPLDIFGYTELRRSEQQLPGEYLTAVDAALTRLEAGGADYEWALKVADAAALIRGYESIKLGSIERFRSAVRELENVPVLAR
jgi:indolepyruvate ferredoxin oxidoreductase